MHILPLSIGAVIGGTVVYLLKKNRKAQED